MTFDSFLDRNRLFAESADRPTLMAMPDSPVLILTCADPRVEPAAFLGVGAAEAVVLRNTGGRVTTSVLADIAMLSQIGEYLRPGDRGQPLEIAVIHHTHCGTAFLDDQGFRLQLATRTGAEDAGLGRPGRHRPVPQRRDRRRSIADYARWTSATSPSRVTYSISRPDECERCYRRHCP